MKVFIVQQGIPELPYSLVFWPNYKFPIKASRLFLRDIMGQYQTPFFTFAETPKEADFFAVPFEFFDVYDHHATYLETVFTLAKANGKKVLLFDYTDYVDRVPTLPPHVILFRVSVYRHHKRPNEIVMPYFVEDLGTRYAIAPKEWKGEPRIGYCGQSDFTSLGRHVRATIKRYLFLSLLLLRFDRQPAVHTRGIFWRRKVLPLLSRSGLPCDFVIRRFYSLHQKSGAFNPEEIRRVYVENLRRSDLALCARGDSNASQRFYEILSASRIPLFLDTDCVLPLEELIDYNRVLIRVPWREVAGIAGKVRSWQSTTSSSAEALKAEQKAREVYSTYLRLDRFFSIVFDRERSPYAELLFT